MNLKSQWIKSQYFLLQWSFKSRSKDWPSGNDNNTLGFWLQQITDFQWARVSFSSFLIWALGNMCELKVGTIFCPYNSYVFLVLFTSEVLRIGLITNYWRKVKDMSWLIRKTTQHEDWKRGALLICWFVLSYVDSGIGMFNLDVCLETDKSWGILAGQVQITSLVTYHRSTC